ncbi:hypothetical protein [Kitasatospora aureofaciens]|uniref:hypothetical protein n=1 Tax=Kitasatospora aureofaciens TaxID=1894 RepID=UPI001C480B76|nr:hypothetical protein [Kitasatospora aureofaciens]MBV6702619.1 hypothetical protein [Kitasatospora aureofaciens]
MTIGDRRLHPRNLDAYATIAYHLVGLDQEDEDGLDGDQDEVPGELDAALE